MSRLILFLAFALLASVTSARASASAQVLIEPTLRGSTPIPDSCFAGDELTLTVSQAGKLVTTDIFCSSYGMATARAVTDKSGHTFILLDYFEGRGTNATTEYLEVDQLGPVLLEVMRVPLSWATDVAQRFTYSYVVEFPASGGLRIHLQGQTVGPPSPNPGMNCCVPDARVLTIDVSGH